MLVIRKSYLLALLMLIASFIAYAEAPLRVLSVNSPPYSMAFNGQVTGYATEVVKLMLKQMEMEEKFAIYPLKRALSIASREANILVYPITRSPEIEDDYYWLGQLSKQNTYLYKLKSNTQLNLTNFADAKHLNVGVVRGSMIEKQLTSLGFSKVQQVTTGLQNVLKLQKHRLDLVASDEVTFSHLIDQANRGTTTKLRYQDFEKVIELPFSSNNQLYIALSKSSSLQLLQRLQKAYHKITESGSIIQVLHWWTMDYETELTDVYRNFMEAKGITWLDYTVEDGAGHNIAEILNPQLNSGHIPQAVRSYMGPALQSWDKSQLLNLNSTAEIENWSHQLPKLIDDGLKIDGDYYAAPANLQRVNWMWLNPKIFAAAKAKIPTSWEEVLGAAEKIRAAGYTPISMGSNSWQEGTLFELLVLSLGGESFYRQALIELDPNAFAAPIMAEVFDLMAKLRSFTDEEQKNTTWMQATHQLINNKAAMYFMGDWVNGAMKFNHVPYGKEGYLCIPVPNTEDILLLNTDVFVFPKTRAEDELSQKTMISMLMNEKIQLAFNQKKGSAPARIDLSLEGFDPCSKRSYHLAQQDRMLPSFNFGQTQPEFIKNKVISVVSGYYRRSLSKEEAILSLQQLLQEYHLDL